MQHPSGVAQRDSGTTPRTNFILNNTCSCTICTLVRGLRRSAMRVKRKARTRVTALMRSLCNVGNTSRPAFVAEGSTPKSSAGPDASRAPLRPPACAVYLYMCTA